MSLPIGSALSSFDAAASGASSATKAVRPAAPLAPAAGGLGDAFSQLISSADDSARSANVAVDRMLDGTGEVHDAMIALQRAELTLQLTVQVRNKLVQAYQDIMRMPV